MKKSIVLIMLSLIVSVGAAAKNIIKKVKNAQGIEVVYQSVYKDKVRPNGVLMTVVGDKVKLEDTNTQSETDKQRIFEENRYIDYSCRRSYRTAEFTNKEVISTITPFEFGEGFKDMGEDTYLGLKCKIVRAIINSNTIDVWYTNDIAFRGTPQSNVGVPDGLVLRIIRNGDNIQEATDIRPISKKALKEKNTAGLFPSDWGKIMELSDYQYALNQSGVIVVPVFDQQSICFTGAKLPENIDDNLQYSAAGGTVILKKVKLPESAKERSVFIEAVQYSDGDAYDRTGSVFMIPTGKEKSFLNALQDLKNVPAFHSDKEYPGIISTDNYDVPVELMRFFTGFGVRKFNHVKVPGQEWVDSVIYKSEVTPLAEQLQGEVWIGAYIGNWDAKGHKLSVKLKYYPDGDRKTVNKTIPLFNTVNYIEQAGQEYPTFFGNDSLRVKFNLKEDAKNVRLYYITTGHGGWGNGDEFNQKPNTIYVDGNKVISFIPWRDDCGTYRNWNPCSGNFSNGLSSSDLSRSNWCPGTVTNPEYIFLGDLSAGEHTISVQIPQGKPEGASISYWCISGTLIY